MKKIIEQVIKEFIEEYCKMADSPNYWKEPLVGYADARHGIFKNIREITGTSQHCMPQDIMEDAKIILVYFLPLCEEIGKSNIKGRLSSDLWNQAYIDSYKMGKILDKRIVETVEELGYHAVLPDNRDYINLDVLRNTWSDRHMAWIAGMGTFGINNLLITKSGCCGFYFSVLTDLPVEPGEILEDEFCLYKRNGSCGLCARRCVANALTVDSFDRKKCYDMVMENESYYPEADACGKCIVGLPCTYRAPGTVRPLANAI